MKEGFSPKALYAFLSGIGPIKEERTRRFFSRLASFVRAHIPDWGEIDTSTAPPTEEEKKEGHDQHRST